MSYFRCAGYHKEKNFAYIADSNGAFDQIWQFSSYLITHGFKVTSVCENFIDVNIPLAEHPEDLIILRALADGQPEEIRYEHKGVTYSAVKVGDAIFIPQKA
jgi:hypothetical protein